MKRRYVLISVAMYIFGAQALSESIPPMPGMLSLELIPMDFKRIDVLRSRIIGISTFPRETQPGQVINLSWLVGIPAEVLNEECRIYVGHHLLFKKIKLMNSVVVANIFQGERPNMRGNTFSRCPPAQRLFMQLPLEFKVQWKVPTQRIVPYPPKPIQKFVLAQKRLYLLELRWHPGGHASLIVRDVTYSLN